MMDSLTVPTTELTSSASATGNPRNKVALKPGRSLMDWIRLTNSSAPGELSTGRRGSGNAIRDVSLEELARHNTKNDAWLALRGFVYNVTAYFEFHPGGEEELSRGIGIDATTLFDQVHQWVNFESMLKKCLVGRLKIEAVTVVKKRPPPLPAINGSGFIAPLLPKPTPIAFSEVTTDWMQSGQTVSVVLYTRQKGLDASRVSTAFEAETGDLRIRVYAEDRRFFDYSVTLASTVDVVAACNLTVSPSTGKVELSLRKRTPDVHWKTIGQIHQGDKGGCFRPLSLAPPFFRQATLQRRETVTHNVDLLTMTFPPGHLFHLPLGWHVQLKLQLEDGSEVSRNYTPVTSSLSSSVDTQCPSRPVDSASSLFFLIKTYPQGPFTSRLHRLPEGSTIQVSDPVGTFLPDTQLEGKSQIVAIAAGTGITPMIRVILDALRDNKCVSVIFFNRERRDIIWNDQFENLKLQHPEMFQIWHVLSEPDDEWKGLRGRISQSILASTIHSSKRDLSGADSFICVCGPSDFTLETLRVLDDAGYKGHNVHAFSG